MGHSWVTRIMVKMVVLPRMKNRFFFFFLTHGASVQVVVAYAFSPSTWETKSGGALSL